MNRLPEFVHKFFWDVNPQKLGIKKDSFFIVERLLEYADDKSLYWLLEIYSDSEIIEVVQKSKKLSPKTINFWINYYNIKDGASYD